MAENPQQPFGADNAWAQPVNQRAADNWAPVTTTLTGRQVTDGVTTSSSTTVTSATASFTSGDVGATISGTNLTSGTYIVSVTNSTTVVVSNAASASGTGLTLTIAKYTQVLTSRTGRSAVLAWVPSTAAGAVIVAPTSTAVQQWTSNAITLNIGDSMTLPAEGPLYANLTSGGTASTLYTIELYNNPY